VSSRSEGAHVYVSDVDGAAADACRRGDSVPLAALRQRRCDVSRGQDVSALFRAIQSAHGKLDVIINNAGLNVREDFRHLTDADWVRIREVNLDGVVRVARDGFELLKASGCGSLVNLASIMSAPRFAPARGLLRDQGRRVRAHARARGRIRAVQHPRECC
jgi:NAD(P)-dependent dehydrogenase (short-subunit alcohol dehydrogenase family)